MTRNFLILLGLLFFSVVNSQEIVEVSKQDVIAKVTANNNSIRISEQEILIAKGDFNQTNAVLLPNILISHTGMATTNPLMAFGSKLNQEILSTNDFNPELLNNPDLIQNFATKIEIQQPLINIAPGEIK